MSIEEGLFVNGNLVWLKRVVGGAVVVAAGWGVLGVKSSAEEAKREVHRLELVHSVALMRLETRLDEFEKRLEQRLSGIQASIDSLRGGR